MSAQPPADRFEAFGSAVTARVGAEAEPWLSGLAELVSSVQATWDLQLTGTAGGVDAFGMTIPARRDDEPVLLRLSYPDGWFFDELTALQAWDGRGSARLLASDPRGAQLRSSPDPGTPLSAEKNRMRALRLAADALRDLWIPAPDGLQSLGKEVATWIGQMSARFESTHRPFERQLLHDAEQLFRTFGPTQSGSVLLHGDARLDTFVRDGDGAVAIDPKPLVGEPAFDVASLVRDRPHELLSDPTTAREALQARLDHLTDLLDVTPSRVKGWSFAVAVDTGLLAFERGDREGGDLLIQIAQLCQSLTV